MKVLFFLFFGCFCAALGFSQSFLSYRASSRPMGNPGDGAGGQSKIRVLGQLGVEGKAGAKVTFKNTPFLEVPVLDFTEAGLNQVRQLADSGELNLALASLTQMAAPSLKADPEKEFLLLERKSYLEVSLLFQLGLTDKVILQSRAFISKFTGGLHFHQVYVLFAQALAAKKLPLEFTSLVDEEFFQSLTPRDAVRLRGLLIKDALAHNKMFDAFGYLQQGEDQLVPGYQQWIGPIVDRFDAHEDLDELIKTYQANRWLVARLKLRKIQLWVRSRQYDQAQGYLGQLLEEKDLDPKLYAEFVALGSFVQNARAVKPYRIGVILPFSHRSFGRLAEQVKEGLEIGFERFSSSERPLELVFKDSAFSPSGPLKTATQRKKHVAELVRQLALEDKVIAILGPLAKGTSLAAGEAADKYKLPLLSFSLTPGIGQNHPYLFRYQRDEVDQAKTIAAYATDYLQAKRFVVLYRPNKRGYNRMRAFVQQVKSQGGKIVGLRPIGRKQVDFQQDFLSFTGGFEPVSEEEKKLMKITRDRLDPVVDFDAIYAPVEPYTMNILIQFANFFEAENSYLLAGHELNRVENQVIKASSRLRFTDTFSISGTNTYLLPFFEEHWKLFNYEPRYQPPSAYGIYGYEALEILVKLLRDPQNHNREALRDQLASLEHFKVMSGEVSTLPNGELYKPSKVLRIRGRNTVEVRGH